MRPEPCFTRSPLGGWQSSIKPMSDVELERYRREAFRMRILVVSLDDPRLRDDQRSTLEAIGNWLWGSR